MQRAANYSTTTDIYTGTQVEEDSFTCFHCSKVIPRKPFQAPEYYGGYCGGCKQLICPECVNLMKCDPLEKKFERYEARDRFLRSAGLL